MELLRVIKIGETSFPYKKNVLFSGRHLKNLKNYFIIGIFF